MLESLTNPSRKEQLEEHMTRIKKDPSLKPILDEIESGGPAAMMKYGMNPPLNYMIFLFHVRCNTERHGGHLF